MTTTAATEVLKVSQTTTLTVEKPDLVIVKMVGTIDGPMMSGCLEAMKRATAGWPHLLMMVFLEHNDGMTADGRKVAAELATSMPFRGTVMVGGNFAIRVVAKMLLQVVNFAKRLDNPSCFCKSEAEGRQWLEERRRALAAGGDH